jgi:hypothetical protein
MGVAFAEEDGAGLLQAIDAFGVRGRDIVAEER